MTDEEVRALLTCGTRTDDSDELLRWATRIGERYRRRAGRQFGRRNAVAGEVLVRVHPTKVVAEKGVSA